MTQNNQNTEVIEVDAEEIPLEEVIDKTLVKHNVTNAIITSLKEKYGELRLRDVEDKENYIEIKAARKEVRKYGILTEKICEEGRSAAIKIQRLWLSKQSEILAKIGEVQNPLDAEIEKFENEVERKEVEEAKKKEGIYMARQSILMKYGAQYNNGSLELNHISYEISLIKEADEEQWNDTILPKYRKVFEEVEAVRVDEENKRKAEIEKQKQDRDAFELQQKKFKEEQELFAKQQSELRQQKEEHERQQRLEQDRKYNEEKQKQQAIINNRTNQLRSLGLNYSAQYDSYVFEDTAISRVVEIEGMDNEKWDELILKITPGIERNKKELEEKRLVQVEKEKQAAIELAAKQEREKIAEEQRQDELKKQQEEQRRQEQLAQSNDKTKWEYFLLQLGSIPFPTEFKSSIYKSKLSIAKEKMEEIKNL